MLSQQDKLEITQMIKEAKDDLYKELWKKFEAICKKSDEIAEAIANVKE